MSPIRQTENMDDCQQKTNIFFRVLEISVSTCKGIFMAKEATIISIYAQFAGINTDRQMF